jgi:hypothetical protein
VADGTIPRLVKFLATNAEVKKPRSQPQGPRHAPLAYKKTRTLHSGAKSLLCYAGVLLLIWLEVEAERVMSVAGQALGLIDALGGIFVG